MPQVRAVRRRGGKDMAALAQAAQAAHGDDIDTDQLDLTSEISVPDNDSDSEFEEPKKARKRRPKADVAPAAKKPRRARKAPEMEEMGSGLYDVVKTGRASLQTVVDDWIESYKNDRDAALLELIQFFIQCSGCKGKISPYMYSNMEHTEIIRKMTEEFDEESGDYPLIMAGPTWKRFRANFCEFIQVLVRQCQYSIIYDQYMMDNIISLLTGLTDSQVRAFRHTSTLAAMKLMTALVDVALNLSINLDNTQRQYEAERQKNQSKRANDRLDLLMTKRQELEDNQEEIRNMLTYIFKGVFVHRYRDTQPDIRSICMAEIGVWMKKYPNMFLDDSYLKYVGWTLYDKTGDVRLCCLRSLSPLYDSHDLSGKLELFTNRFKVRIVEMTLDKENEVAVQAIKLCTSVLRYSDTVLSDKDCENVYELVYSSNRHVSQAAGEFLNYRLFQRDDEAAEVKSKKGKKRSPNTPLVRDLVQFFIESELHEHGAYLVDSLWEINDMVRDWECMTDLLFEEPGKGEEALDDRQETSLIEIMVCCAKQAATGESPVGRGTAKKMTTKERKDVMEEKSRLTEHFIVTLPQLLAKYLMDPEKVANLLQIPQYFDLEIYTTSRQEKNLENLLRYLHEIVEKHTDTEVLEACSKAYECLCSDEFAIASKCDVERSTLLDSIVQQFEEAMQEYFSDGEEPDEDETFALLANLKRIHAFYGCHDLSRWNLWDGLFHVVKAAGPAIPEEIVCNAIGSCYFALQQYLVHLDGQNSPDSGEILQVKKRLADMMGSCRELLNQDGRICEEAYITICDLLIIFGHGLGENNALLKNLVYLPEKGLESQLSQFLTDKVFIEDDDDEVDENVKIEELHKKRNFLAAFCKLIIYNVIHIRTATEMFKYYMRFYNDYGDIIKATLSKTREINKVITAKTLALSLMQLFNDLKAEQQELNRASDAFQSIKELGRRFALSFGLDQVKNREAMAALHKEGIDFVMSVAQTAPPGTPPVNVSFLEVLAEFTNKLMKQDKKTVVMYLDKNISPDTTTRSSEWQSYIIYRNSLVQGEAEVNPILLRPAIPAQPVGRRGKRKHDSTENDDLTNQWAHTPAPMSALPQHSTAIKARRGEDEMSEQGSENDFEESSIAQASWLQQRRDFRQREEMSYTRSPRYTNLPRTEEVSEPPSIADFSSPDLSQGQGHMQGGLFDDDAHITDESPSRGIGNQLYMMPRQPPTPGLPHTPLMQPPSISQPPTPLMQPHTPIPPIHQPHTPLSQTPIHQPHTPLSQSVIHQPHTPLSPSVIHQPHTPLSQSMIHQPHTALSQTPIHQPHTPLMQLSQLSPMPPQLSPMPPQLSPMPQHMAAMTMASLPPHLGGNYQ